MSSHLTERASAIEEAAVVAEGLIIPGDIYAGSGPGYSEQANRAAAFKEGYNQACKDAARHIRELTK